MNKLSGAIALIGNPNSGKTALFNALTGLNHKVSNYPGVTVERKTGSCTIGDDTIEIIDLPGTYSLVPESQDEVIVAMEVDSWLESDHAPACIISVVDATNLERNLYLTSQLLDLGIPVIVA
ncbi:MAG: FeoB small GTPase domain-containing protein, partial [Candidatus Neomarinimicrobiota bacterium]|nr:FeoB small GTPase domain-containing protein [Candidatus Neomarinimicrobiota bacterium]